MFLTHRQRLLCEKVYSYSAYLSTRRWTAAVSAQNSISSAISDTVEIEVQAKVSNLEIIVDTNHTLRLVNRTITFEYFTYSGSKLRLTWSFGDGSRIENTTDKRVEHTFARYSRISISWTRISRSLRSSKRLSESKYILIDFSNTNLALGTYLQVPITRCAN